MVEAVSSCSEIKFLGFCLSVGCESLFVGDAVFSCFGSNADAKKK